MTGHVPIDFYTLHGPHSSLVIEASPGAAPIWRYWGPRLPDGAAPDAALTATRPPATFSLNADVPLTVFPLNGTGWFNQTALLAHRAGLDWAQAATSAQVVQAGPHSLHITLIDAVCGIDVMITLGLCDQTDVLTVSTRLTNRGAASLSVQWLAAATLPLPQTAEQVRFFGGRHQNEFAPQCQILSRSVWRRENRRGLTSHDTPPTGFVESPEGVFAAHMAWSGNSVQQIEWLDDGQYQWQWGEWLAPGEVTLAPGEHLETPDVIATFSPDGMNGVMQNFHTEMRRRLAWPGGAMRPRPVQINTWEGFYFKHDFAGMCALADEAAAIGIERFVLDDGWFHARNDDTTSLGDWWPDAKKYPDGLRPLAEHVTARGLEFGLWFEPEMVNPDSELARQHPGWILRTDGRPDLTARNQLVLDLAQPGVSDYLFARMAALLTDLPISYIKWDHNRDLAATGLRAPYRMHVHAAYALMARLRQAFPQVEIEACAGGGGRIDAGVLAHTHRFWTSDNLDAVSRLVIQRGFLSVFPPEIMGAHVGTAPAHGTRRTQALDFRAGVALPGHFGVELDLFKLSARAREKLVNWIQLHKSLRDHFHHGKVWLGEAGDGAVWQAHGAPDDLIVIIYRAAPSQQKYAPAVRLAMLNPNWQYALQRLDPAVTPFGAEGANASPLIAGAPVSGAWLIHHGLVMPMLGGEQVAIFRIRANM
jgi:alpha-galactosidase